MEVTTFHMLYDSVRDFKHTAFHIESEIQRYGLSHERDDVVPETNGRIHREMWVSMKTVSHFNLGMSLELLLKLLMLRLTDIHAPNHHNLTKLYDLLPKKIQKLLEETYQENKNANPEGIALIAFCNSDSQKVSAAFRDDQELSNLRAFLTYFDEDAKLYSKRYSYELVEQRAWRHYLSDISVFVGFIGQVLREVGRN